MIQFRNRADGKGWEVWRDGQRLGSLLLKSNGRILADWELGFHTMRHEWVSFAKARDDLSRALPQLKSTSQASEAAK